MIVAVPPSASGAEQNSAYAQLKEGRSGKPRRPSLLEVQSGKVER
jgi:hypothetical protein